MSQNPPLRNIGTCMGDSGGPLVDVSDPNNKVLVGLVSWGVPVSTRLSKNQNIV